MEYRNVYKVGEYISTTESRLLNNMIRKENTDYNVYMKDEDFVLLKDEEEIYKSKSFSDMSFYISKLTNNKCIKEKEFNKDTEMLEI